MIVTWRFLSVLSLVSYTKSQCSSTSYYRNCWIRRFPGLHVDADESQRRGAQLLRLYREESAQNCSRACCLTSNFSCNVAVFHYNTTQDSVNCFHLHCPSLQSCALHQRANVILFNVTKGMDPDLLIFGNLFPSNVQVLPHLASLNTSDLSGTDKRQFNRPQVEPSSPAHPTLPATSPKTSTNATTSNISISTPPPLPVYTTQDNQGTLPTSAIQRSTTLKRSSQLISTRIVTNPLTDPSIISTTKASPPPSSTVQPSFSFTNRQTSSMPQPVHTFRTTFSPLQLSSQVTSSSPFSSQGAEITRRYTISHSTSTQFKTLPILSISTISSGHTTSTTPGPFSDTLETTTTFVHLTITSQSRTGATPSLFFPLPNSLQSITGEATTMSAPLSSAPHSITVETTTTPDPLSSILPVDLSSIPKISTKQTITMPTLLSDTLPISTQESTIPSGKGETTTIPVPLPSILQSSKEETTAHTTLSTAQLSPSNAPFTSTPLTPPKTTTGYVTTGQVKTNSLTTTSWSHNHSQITASPPMGKRNTPFPTTGSQSASTDVSSTTIGPTALNIHHSTTASPETNSGLNTSPTPPSLVEDSQPYLNDTKGYISRNITTGNSQHPVSDGGLTQAWHLAANTVLVTLATCAALACGCCCSVLMAASWRGRRRRRKGRYQTTLIGNKGSMRLIKYVFVRESS
ncbi:mucin-2-like [Silurus meridionalis]|uniref:MANSC domain-containing protein n=1 Tax=Silurus meridionalis TaxID=175797 RepID=A0A8T0B8B4_SILME|nr:mucin-2-like [Silurus meridionalis]KAF7701881.1 hypothetical protein HF521_001164 [Silurus meridionalis]KAI5100272.1 hypothetical protein C0J45_9258 [Silurus meridionalis]